MHDTGKIIIGIIIFVLLFTSPILLNLTSGQSKASPRGIINQATTKTKADGNKYCIESGAYMNHNHMEMLNEWRDSVVRLDSRFRMSHGQRIERSLSKTCMSCHSNKVDFCDRCHNYLGVAPYCWDCHVTPEEVK
ncbi:MAG: hypothetical protein QG635_1957 [Bacteroidota bacterium]|nr:hypothetical protein [Bacteroidota bacterium]